jgi:D-3-phosphoglycerate dehydrogenase
MFRLLNIVLLSLEKALKKILITTSTFNSKESSQLQELEKAGFQIEFNPYGRRLTEEQITTMLDATVVGMVAGLEPLSEKVLQKADALKVISRCGTATENVDKQFALQKGIQVCNTPLAPSLAVAELVLGFILNSLRKISAADNALRQGNWKPLMGDLLSSKLVGIVGYGHIGRRVAALCAAFGAKVIVSDLIKLDLPDENIQQVDFAQLVTQADIVSLHVPLLKETTHLFDQEVLAKLKPNCLLVNTARGGLIDEAALVQILQIRPEMFAALDVYQEEPYAGELTKLSNTLLTCHMGSYAKAARLAMEEEALSNLIQGLQEQGMI